MRPIQNRSGVRIKAPEAIAAQTFNNSGYANHGASALKKALVGWLAGGGSHKEDIEDNIEILRERCRDLYMGSAIAAAAIKTMRTNVVGYGLTLKSTLDREVLGLEEKAAAILERKIEREFALWADSTECDLMRLDNFKELQQLSYLNWLLSGDVIATLPRTKRINMPYDLRINLIEADRLCNPGNEVINPKITAGVEMNDVGEVVAYHIAKHHPLSFDYVNPEWVRVEAFGKKTGRRNVLHLMSRERIGQVRGVPELAKVIEPIKQLTRYSEAEITAAVVNAIYAIFIEKEQANSDGVPLGEVVADDMQVDAGDEKSIEVAPGAIIDLAPGEKANMVTPGRPNSNFGDFVKAVLQQIGAALEIPLEVLLKAFNSNYSASRGALLEFWKFVAMHRSWLVADFCQPIYEEFLAEAVAKNRISAPGFFSNPIYRKAWCRAVWYGPTNGQLNPIQEVTAAIKKVENGFASRSQMAQELSGTNYFDNVTQLKIENEQLKGANEIDTTGN